MDNWDDLRHFLAVARAGSLGAAAKDLGVDQSTVFRRLRSLEKYLGTQIFERRQHGSYELTPAGDSLLTQADRIEAATFNIDRDVLGRDLQLSGLIRVTTADDIAAELLPRHLLAFQQSYPAISVELLTANRFFSLNRGEADVAIRPGDPVAEAQVIPRHVCPTCFGLFASPAYLRQAGRPAKIKDLNSHQMIGWKGDLYEHIFNTVLNEVDKPNIAYSSNSLLAQRAMVENDMGIAMLPEFLGAASGRLERILPRLRPDSGNLWILYHDKLRHAARLRAFVDFMLAALRQDPLLGYG